MRLQQFDLLDQEPGVLRILHDIPFARHLSTGEDLCPEKSKEAQITHCQRDAHLMQFTLRIAENAVQQHPSVIGKDVVGTFEERGIPHLLEGVEGLDGDDPIDLLVELFPALQARLDIALRRNLGELGLAALVVIAAQRDADDGSA